MYKVLICAILVIFSVSCHKALSDVNDYFPKLKTISASIQPDGTVLLTGSVDSEGAAPVEYLGFCCSTNPKPQLLDRQALATTYSGGKFTAVYSGGFDPDSTYYFRSWGTNDYGYVYGDIVSLGHIIGTPITPPCSLALNTCNIGGGQPTDNYYTSTVPSAYLGVWEFSADTYNTGVTVNFKFGSELTNAIFKTASYNNPGPGQVYISFYVGSISGTLKDGSNVYVTRISNGIYDISICDAPWSLNGGSNLYFNSRLKTHL
jgi:hypothetical protein